MHMAHLAPSHIVGVGASAGGLEALEQFFAHMPMPNGMAFVVVQHLSPDFKSLMDQLLTRHTQMPIHRVADGMSVDANAIYLIPPRKDLVIEHGTLRLAEPTRSNRGMHLPIDTFFAALAEDVGERAVGIVLSGTGSDGTRGIRAIKEAGGMVMVQNADTAQFGGMPRNALATGLADYVLAPAEMPAALLTYTRHLLPSVDEPGAPATVTEEHQFAAILALLQQVQGIDFTPYKTTTVQRRIARRLGIMEVPDMAAYLELLRTSPQELRALHGDLLICVTGFFRDPDAFAMLQQEVLMPLLQSAADPIRVWVAACATGEEAYSIAMLLHEQLERLAQRPEVQIFATDVNKEAVEYAAHGVYPESIMADISPERLQRFFTRLDNRYRVARSLREMVIFAPHNLLKDPPFTKMDLVTCRNCLIYLDLAMQKKVLSLLHYALNPQGSLFLGTSETAGELAEEFHVVHPRWKIFRKVRDVRLPAATRGLSGFLEPFIPQPVLPWREREEHHRSDPRLFQAYERIVEDYCPPLLLVSEQYTLLRTIGDTAPYLKKPTGTPTLHVLHLLVDDLTIPVATALHKAAAERQEVIYSDVRVRTDDLVRRLTLRVKWIPERQRETPLFAIAFEEALPARPLLTEAEPFDAATQTHQRLHDLEQELRYTQENLQASIEELETSNEELQATNEELVATNEELQSTNEELQSVNEELYTVNAEYQSKIQELTNLNNDVNNLLRSTDMGTVFLDRNLCIRKFTPAATAFLHLREHDLGRPLAYCTHTFVRTDLSSDAQEVLHTGVRIEKEVETHAGSWFLMRTLPFLSAADMCEGVVLSCIDITHRKRAEEAVRRSQAQLQQILDHAPAAIYIKDTAGRYLLVNRQYETQRQRPSEHILGQTTADLFPSEAARTLMAHDQQVLAANAPITFEETSADGLHTYLSVKFPLCDSTGVTYALCGISTDITVRKHAEAALQDAKGELEHRVRDLSRLTTLIETTSDLVAIANTRAQILYLNAAGRRMLGVAAEGPVDLRVADVVPAPVLRAICEEGMPMASRHGTWTGEAAVLGGDGREIPVSLVIIAHTAPSGEVEAFSTIMRDITEQRRSQEILRRRAEEMETFAYSASHDLQAPLRTFEGYARWLLEDYGHVLESEGRQLCEEIMADAMHMKTLLDGLLEYSRIGRLDPQAVVVDTKSVFDWVLHDLQLEIVDKGAIIHLPETYPTVIYPEGRLTQVFSNLISNALKFTTERPPEITIDYAEHPGYYRFSVRDNGIGIAPEHHERIFEIFKRLHTREAYPGTGAGLTIVKRIVETHGGQIGVESTPGEGATFWVTIPRSKLSLRADG